MKKIERIEIFGRVPFDRIVTAELISEILKAAKNRRKRLILNMNTYGVVTFLENRKYARIIRSADIIYPDGYGPVFVSKHLKDPLLERVNVGDFIDELLSKLGENKLRLFLLGSDEDLVVKTSKKIKNKYRGIVLCGCHHGFFSKEQARDVCSLISKAKPNLVLVGMGIPIQEYFISDNWNKLPQSIYMGVGGVFNYIANTKKRAPKWMREKGLEWFYRLCQEPTRLWKRYTLINIKFVIYLFKFVMRGNV